MAHSNTCSRCQAAIDDHALLGPEPICLPTGTIANKPIDKDYRK